LDLTTIDQTMKTIKDFMKTKNDKASDIIISKISKMSDCCLILYSPTKRYKALYVLSGSTNGFFFLKHDLEKDKMEEIFTKDLIEKTIYGLNLQLIVPTSQYPTSSFNTSFMIINFTKQHGKEIIENCIIKARVISKENNEVIPKENNEIISKQTKEVMQKKKSKTTANQELRKLKKVQKKQKQKLETLTKNLKILYISFNNELEFLFTPSN